MARKLPCILLGSPRSTSPTFPSPRMTSPFANCLARCVGCAVSAVAYLHRYSVRRNLRCAMAKQEVQGDAEVLLRAIHVSCMSPRVYAPRRSLTLLFRRLQKPRLSSMARNSSPGVPSPSSFPTQRGRRRGQTVMQMIVSYTSRAWQGVSRKKIFGSFSARHVHLSFVFATCLIASHHPVWYCQGHSDRGGRQGAAKRICVR